MTRPFPDMPIHLKRAYEEPAKADGWRVLVERLWPRGVAKDAALIDEWVKDAAPSTELRKWFGHDPAKWEEFRARYFAELDDRPGILDELARRAKRGKVTFVYGSRETRFNAAVALREYLGGK